MKCTQFIAHLKKNGCSLLRNGANHDIYINAQNTHQSTVGRHAELDNKYCKMVCKQLGIPII
jgi:predicted RNA binding protein YcfA (HicA-like mRNA interferase family)